MYQLEGDCGKTGIYLQSFRILKLFYLYVRIPFSFNISFPFPFRIHVFYIVRIFLFLSLSILYKRVLIRFYDKRV